MPVIGGTKTEAVNREQFYVSISRGRDRCQVFADAAELLQRRIGDSNTRTAAIELLRDALDVLTTSS